MSGNEGYITTDDGVRLFFRTRGNAADVAVIPGGLYFWEELSPLAGDRTLVAFDLRNRGYSDSVSDLSKLGIGHDVTDIDRVRKHFGLSRVDLIGHSYVGLLVALYAMRHSEATRRVVQIGPMSPRQKPYPAHLSNNDGVLATIFAALAELQKERASLDPIEFCRKSWAQLSRLYVTDPADASKADWGRCELANERNFMGYWTGLLLPSIHQLDLPAEAPHATAPVLVVHGTKDRSAPYGGGREWALMLPNARLLTMPEAGHAPWIEAPNLVLPAIRSFLGGHWPDQATKITALDPIEEA